MKVAEKLNVSPSESVAFEDALSGIRAAHSAGAAKIVAIASSAEPEYLASAKGVTLATRDYTEDSIKVLF